VLIVHLILLLETKVIITTLLTFSPYYLDTEIPILICVSSSHNKGPKQSSNSSSTAIIIGVAIGGSSLMLVLLALAGFYAFRQRRRAERAISRSNPFGK